MSSPMGVENDSRNLNMDVTDNDLTADFQELCTKVRELEQEKKEICENYDAQRGKLHKLYLQKESELKEIKSRQNELEREVERLSKELDEAKSQLCIAGIVKENEVEAEKQRAQAEIATLNQIVNESVEVSTTSQCEVKMLRQVNQMLELQVRKLKSEKEKEGILLAPSNVLSGAKSLAKKVVGQLGNDSDFRSHDNLEDSMKKAQEDAEVIRSLVMPLENQIQQLSKKLVVAEEKLKMYESGEALCSASPGDRNKNDKNLIDLSYGTSEESVSPKALDSRSPLKAGPDVFSLESSIHQPESGVSPSKSVACDMCVNYEAQLVTQQQLALRLKKEKKVVEANMERIKEDLVKEAHFKKCMEDKWNEKKEEHKVQVSELKSMYENAEKEIRNLRKFFEKTQEEVKGELSKLRFDREKINDKLEELQRENDNLIGKYSAHSEQLRNESINFPDNVEELQEALLKIHEELIAAKVAEETKDEEVKTLTYENELLREQMKSEMLSKQEIENKLAVENKNLREQLETKMRECQRFQDALEKLKSADRKNEEQIRTLRKHLEDMTKEKRQYEESISELRSQVGSLQQELDTSETVQKDFVRLSQSLQIELEKIRGADTEVRWQHDDDASECLGCRHQFTGGKGKDHCRHCGKIFCASCLTHIVLSGPNKRPSRVCQVCNTLLNRETAPYFSQEPPHSPD